MTDDREDDLSPEEIARLDKARYEEPDRDLSATRPAPDAARGAGSAGDVDNPAAATDSHGLSDPDPKLGSDERNLLGGKRRK